jgi:C1A family cysteine protease
VYDWWTGDCALLRLFAFVRLPLAHSTANIIEMRVILSLALFCLISFTAATTYVSELGNKLLESSYQAQFSAFTKIHNKQYDSAQQLFSRYNIFKSNLDRINAHNAAAAKGAHTYTVAVNQFADMTNEEYRQLLLSKSKPSSSSAAEEHITGEIDAVPTSWDWRSKGVVTPIKNQGQCNFTSTSSLG